MKLLKYALASVAAAALVACGGGGGGASETRVVADAPAVAVNATTGAVVAQALAGKSIAFANGVPDFGTVAATTLAITAGVSPSFVLSEAGKSAEGDLAFGSCIFKITKSDFVAPHKLAAGNTITVNDCEIDFDTEGAQANGQSHAVDVVVTLNGVASDPVTTTVVVQPNGDIVVGGTTIAEADVTVVTGGS